LSITIRYLKESTNPKSKNRYINNVITLFKALSRQSGLEGSFGDIAATQLYRKDIIDLSFRLSLNVKKIVDIILISFKKKRNSRHID
jgi:uncharacterized membrane protein YsdA (DUF1294 family)